MSLEYTTRGCVGQLARIIIQAKPLQSWPRFRALVVDTSPKEAAAHPTRTKCAVSTRGLMAAMTGSVVCHLLPVRDLCGNIWEQRMRYRVRGAEEEQNCYSLTCMYRRSA